MPTRNPELQSRLDALCDACASFYSRSLACGSTGNLSIRDGEDLFVTPTGGSLRNLTPKDLAHVSISTGEPRNDRHASKEIPLHLRIGPGV